MKIKQEQLKETKVDQKEDGKVIDAINNLTKAMTSTKDSIKLLSILEQNQQMITLLTETLNKEKVEDEKEDSTILVDSLSQINKNIEILNNTIANRPKDFEFDVQRFNGFITKVVVKGL